ncbi:hypothetical protein K443DRAFT_676091 [Laccaria amethystina LaAM-08-1]|uniref:Uncharacterized protein n=1 Tax=Laccaria amethystina LaAM-08-1 TaxID=1095629 RepID=A0A0C9XH98_9AGAR|nr:hypothetical protein K443DRAFT_676091 [Laccaria amethystina LaAM-08-1]
MLDAADDFSNSLSIDELRWLEASAIFDFPTRPLSEKPISCDNTSPPLSPENICVQPATPPPRRSRSATVHASAPSSEWIYRRPKSPPDSHRRTSTHTPYLTTSRPRNRSGQDVPSSVSRSLSNSSTRTETGPRPAPKRDRQDETNSISPFWPTILRPRSRSERSTPLLKSIPSVNVASPSPTFISSFSTLNHTSPSRPVRVRSASIASTLSSTSSHSSSTPETPISPGFAVPCSKPRRTYQRRNNDPRLPPLSASCPSKSILTRTSSISTKDSTITTHKSVKFVDAPTVHYAAPSYWSADESIDLDVAGDGLDMGIDVDGMDMDMPVSMERTIYPGRDQLGPAHLCEELRPSAPTPQKEKPSSLKRFNPLTRKVPDAPSASTNQLHSTSPRPTISGPYALGTFHSLPRSSTSADMAQSGISLRPAPSLESFRSFQSTATRSAHSVGSVRSTASTRGFRAWLERIGNAWPGT